MGKTEAQVLGHCCVESCPSELGIREAADLPRSTAKLRNAADHRIASECDRAIKTWDEVRSGCVHPATGIGAETGDRIASARQ
jgi:hypothetical protein